MKKQICVLDHEDQSIFQLKCLTQSILLSIFICARLILGFEISRRCKHFRDASGLPKEVVEDFLSKSLRS